MRACVRTRSMPCLCESMCLRREDLVACEHAPVPVCVCPCVLEKIRHRCADDWASAVRTRHLSMQHSSGCAAA